MGSSADTYESQNTEVSLLVLQKRDRKLCFHTQNNVAVITFCNISCANSTCTISIIDNSCIVKIACD